MFIELFALAQLLRELRSGFSLTSWKRSQRASCSLRNKYEIKQGLGVLESTVDAGRRVPRYWNHLKLSMLIGHSIGTSFVPR